MVNEKQNDPKYEVFLALSRLTNADSNIRFFKNDEASVSIRVTYHDAHGYKLSCGYWITNIGIFDSRDEKVEISKTYEEKLYKIAEKKFDSIRKISH